MKIDVHCHYLPTKFSELIAKQYPFPSTTWKQGKLILQYFNKIKIAINPAMYSAEQILSSMDEAGIDISMISGNAIDVYCMPEEDTVTAARIINEDLAEITEQHRGRFFPIATIPWTVPEAALEEICYIHRLGFKGVMLHSSLGDKLVDHPSLAPLYAKCAELGLPVVLHPTIAPWFQTIEDYSLAPMVGLPMDTSLALLRLILSGVVENNPGVKWVMPHAGGILPFMDGRIRNQTEVMKRGVENITISVTRQLREGNIWYDTVSPSVESLHYLNDYCGADKIMFATDYPYISTKYFVDLLEQTNFSQESMEKIYWKNAAYVFNLELY